MSEIGKALASELGSDRVFEDEATRAEHRVDYWVLAHLRRREGRLDADPSCVVRPRTTEEVAKALNADTQPITVSVKADGQVFLQETAIPIDEVAAKLQAVATTGYTERIFVRGDGNAPYGVIADVMSRIQAGGFTNIGLVTEQKPDN